MGYVVNCKKTSTRQHPAIAQHRSGISKLDKAAVQAVVTALAELEVTNCDFNLLVV